MRDFDRQISFALGHAHRRHTYERERMKANT